jgi:hypothetical protein
MFPLQLHNISGLKATAGHFSHDAAFLARSLRKGMPLDSDRCGVLHPAGDHDGYSWLIMVTLW